MTIFNIAYWLSFYRTKSILAVTLITCTIKLPIRIIRTTITLSYLRAKTSSTLY